MTSPTNIRAAASRSFPRISGILPRCLRQCFFFDLDPVGVRGNLEDCINYTRLKSVLCYSASLVWFFPYFKGIVYNIKIINAGVPEWSNGQGLGPCDAGLREFETRPPQTSLLKEGIVLSQNRQQACPQGAKKCGPEGH
jgi:hypothetical protein